MPITPIQNQIFNQFKIPDINHDLYRNGTNNVLLNTAKKSKNNTIRVVASAVSLTALAIGLFALIKNGKFSNITNKIKEILGIIPNNKKLYDIEYKQDLLTGLQKTFGIEKTQEDLKSVMGQDEFKELMKKADPEDFFFHEKTSEFYEKIKKYKIDTHGHRFHELLTKNLSKEEVEGYYEPFIKGKCRIFLHSKLSPDIVDPKEAAKSFLESANAYANKVAKKVKDNRPPFTVGFREGYGVDVQQHIIKELSENPKKYKNLRVILGVEEFDKTTKNKVDKCYHFINPFDDELIEHFKLAKQKHSDIIKNILRKCFIPSEGEETKFSDINSLVIGSSSTKTLDKGEIPKGWRLTTDDDIKSVFESTDRKHYRDPEMEAKSIFEHFYKKFIYMQEDEHFEDDKNLITLFKMASKRAGYDKSHSAVFDTYKNFQIKTNLEDALKNQKYAKRLVTPEYTRQVPDMWHPKEIGDKLHNSSPMVVNEFKDVFGEEIIKGEKIDYKVLPEIPKEEMLKILPEGSKEMIIHYDFLNCFKPTKHIIGDRIGMTDDIWQKIIS